MKIFVTTEFESTHRWPAAPPETYYLRNEHRHLFKVRLEIEVVTSDRDLEFITIKKELNELIKDLKKEPRTLNWSCERFALEILTVFSDRYLAREMSCEVSEDGENGAVVDINREGKIC